ncbi:hypothetical protein D7Z54_02305 [Salibacterium salarium]|uniref:Uncharacterized protein n=1 Tax=Salibacterium salarium TaxID=284579 RepID=A0A428N8G5_9BACI|nr:hypothetical protein [Salibacterium salarium]RSL34694.1 hypothetical protein D7Z54_02305 [Salibacterium salarium]
MIPFYRAFSLSKHPELIDEIPKHAAEALERKKKLYSLDKQKNQPMEQPRFKEGFSFFISRIYK